MLKFEPQWYFRLIKRRSNIVYGHVEYDLTPTGIEEPECTIVPLMTTTNCVGGEYVQEFYLSYLDKVYQCTVVSQLVNGDTTLRVPIHATPVATYEVPATRTAPPHADPAAPTRPRPTDS